MRSTSLREKAILAVGVLGAFLASASQAGGIQPELLPEQQSCQNVLNIEFRGRSFALSVKRFLEGAKSQSTYAPIVDLTTRLQDSAHEFTRLAASKYRCDNIQSEFKSLADLYAEFNSTFLQIRSTCPDTQHSLDDFYDHMSDTFLGLETEMELIRKAYLFLT